MAIYQYLVLVSIYSTNFAEIRQKPLAPAGGPAKQTWTSTYYLWRPDSTKAEERSGHVEFVTLLNELGREGWRLVESAIPDSVVVADGAGWYGWPEAGIPIRQRWTFMREVSS